MREIMDGVRALAKDEAERRARAFAEENGMEFGEAEAVMTDEQASREYGTPETDAEPWLIGTLGGVGHGR
jgi:hypothetical protein